MEKMMKNTITRFFYLIWKYYSFKFSIGLGVMFYVFLFFLRSGSGRGMSGTSTGITRQHSEILKETGIIDSFNNLNKVIYQFIESYINLGEVANHILVVFFIGSIFSLFLGFFVWVIFEFSFFTKVYIFKEDKNKTLEDLKKRLRFSIKENNI